MNPVSGLRTCASLMACAAAGVLTAATGFGVTSGGEDLPRAFTARSGPAGVSLNTPVTVFDQLPGSAGWVAVPILVTNTGCAVDSFQVSVSGEFVIFVSGGGGILGPGQSEIFTVTVGFGSDVLPGTSGTTVADAVSLADPNATATLTVSHHALHAPPTLGLHQPSPGSPVQVQIGLVFNLISYHCIFSVEPCPQGPGGGAYVGLCANDPGFLLAQYFSPLGTLPFHFNQFPTTLNFNHTVGAYPAPPGLVVESLCIYPTLATLPGSAPFAVTPVSRYTVQ